MNNIYSYEILSVNKEDNNIISAEYVVSAKDDFNSVSIKGNICFVEPYGTTPFEEVSKDQISNWIINSAIVNDENIIHSCLDKQLSSLKNIQNQVTPPWVMDKLQVAI